MKCASIHSNSILVTFCLLLVWGNWAQTQSLAACEKYDVHANSLTADLCSTFIGDREVYVPVSSTLYPQIQPTIDKTLNESIIYTLSHMVSIFPQNCFNSIISLICNTAYPPCNSVVVPELNTSVIVRSPYCYSTCEAVNGVCSDFFDLVKIPINCSDLDKLTKQPLWPQISETTNFESIPVTSQCLPFSQLFIPAISRNSEVNSCPFPTVRNPKPTMEESICAIPCPDPSWTRHQWFVLGEVQFGFALLSFILMALLSIHYIVDPKCRNSTKRFQLYSFLCQMMFAFSFLLNGTDPIHNVWCKTDYSYATLDNKPACGTQGVLFVLFGLSASIWWAIVSINLYFQLERQQHQVSRQLEVFCNLVAFGIPTALITIASVMNHVQFYYFTPICFIEGTPNSDSDFSVHYAFFYIPMSISIITAFCFLGATIRKVVLHIRSVGGTFYSEQTNKYSLLQANIRLFVWCSFLFLFFFALILYRLLIETHIHHFIEDIISWESCKITYYLGLSSDDLCQEDIFPRSLNYPGTVVYYIVIVSMGTFSFITFGTSANIYYYWRFLLSAIASGNWKLAKRLVMEEKVFTKMKTAMDHPSQISAIISTGGSDNSPTPQQLDSLNPSTITFQIPTNASNYSSYLESLDMEFTESNTSNSMY